MPIERLELEGFRSHANTTLDLVGVRAATFVGLVGSGKSSFQEAFRWLLFGESDCSDRGYVKLGANRCRVMAIVRTLAGSRYRAERIQTVTGTSLKTDLQLQVANGAGGWTPAGGKRIAETEAKIRAEVVGMDYDTLISSAISPQGRSSMFTRPPKMFIDGKYYEGRQARIQIFAQSEGLGVWEEWRKTGTKGANDADRQATTLEAQVVAADGELARRPGIETSLQAAVMTQAASHDKQTALSLTIEKSTQDLAERRGTLEPLRRELAGFADTRQTLWTKNRQACEKTARVETLTALLSRRAEIEAAAAKVAELDTLLATQRQELAGLEAEGKGVRQQHRTADLAVQAANVTHVMVGGRLFEASRKVENRPKLEAQIGQLTVARANRGTIAERNAHAGDVLTAKQGSLSGIMAANLSAQKQAGEIEAEARKVGAQRTAVGNQLAADGERAGLIDVVPCKPQPDLVSICPLLTNARRASEGLPALTEEHATLCAWVCPTSPPQQETAALRGEISKIEAAIAADRKTLAALEAEIASLQPAEAELASLDTIQATIPGLEADEATARTARDAAVLAAANLRASLDAVTVRYLALLGKIKDAVASRETLAPTATLAPELAHADADLSNLQADVAALTTEIQTLQAALDREATVKATIAEAERSILLYTGVLENQREDLEQHKRTEAGALQEAATFRAELAGLEKLAADREQAAVEAARLREEHTMLVALCLAYRQIPIMILETAAVPEVMEEASRILARISRNGMSTRLATFREVKSREELADGLDIFIQDRLGERTYENYSGGQEGQIDFAYRLALVKRQARRRTGGLGVLWIDEGFETQDAGDLPPLIELLREMERDYAQTFITTHVEGMKETFPAQVRVDGGDGRDSVAELVMA